MQPAAMQKGLSEMAPQIPRTMAAETEEQKKN